MFHYFDCTSITQPYLQEILILQVWHVAQATVISKIIPGESGLRTTGSVSDTACPVENNQNTLSILIPNFKKHTLLGHNLQHQQYVIPPLLMSIFIKHDVNVQHYGYSTNLCRKRSPELRTNMLCAPGVRAGGEWDGTVPVKTKITQGLHSFVIHSNSLFPLNCLCLKHKIKGLELQTKPSFINI